MSESTQRLIRDLTNELPPVRPVPRLRVSLAWVLALGVSAVVLGALGLGLNDQLPGELSRSPVLVSMALSLIALALGCFLGAVAGGVPGREGSARRGWALAAFGAALGLVCAFWLGVQALASSGFSPSLRHALSCLACIGIAALIAIPGAVASTVFLARAAPSRGPSLVAAGALGAASLGGIATLAHCPQMDPVHLMLGHTLAPLFGLAFLFLPALLLWRGLAPGFVTER